MPSLDGERTPTSLYLSGKGKTLREGKKGIIIAISRRASTWPDYESLAQKGDRLVGQKMSTTGSD